MLDVCVCTELSAPMLHTRFPVCNPNPQTYINGSGLSGLISVSVCVPAMLQCMFSSGRKNLKIVILAQPELKSFDDGRLLD